MRILLTTDTIGGVWTFALDLARSLDHQVHVATMGRELTAAQREQARGLTLHESAFKLEWMPEPWADVDAAGRWLLQLEAAIQPDVIHLNTLVHGDLPWRAPAMVTAHSCVLSWWEAVKGERAPAEWDKYRRRVSSSLRAAALVTAPSEAMLESVRRHYGYQGEAAAIPNGRPAEFYRAAVKEPFIFAAGRAWDEAKNLASLARIAGGVSWPIHIAGEGSALGVLEPAALAELYSRASIYAWPAKYEPFGFSVLEAALSGCALVLGDIPSLRENWDGAAEFVTGDDALASALQRLTADPDRLADLAQRASERARNFALEKMTARYNAAYQAVRSLTLCAS